MVMAGNTPPENVMLIVVLLEQSIRSLQRTVRIGVGDAGDAQVGPKPDL
jgi:hypothetical protein